MRLIHKILIVFFLVTTFKVPFCKAQNEGSYGQNDSRSHSLGDISISASANVLFNTPNTVQPAGGIKLRLFVGKRFSFDTDLVFGRDYIHAGPGIIGIPTWILVLGTFNNIGEGEDRSLSDLLFIAVAMALSAEHFAYHVPVSSSVDISPYLSCLRYKSAYEYGNYSDTNMVNEQLTFATGVELNKYYKRFLLSPYLEFAIGYVDHKPGINAGVYFGMFFLNKKLRQS